MSNDDDDIEAQKIIDAAKMFEDKFDRRGAPSDDIHSKEEAIEWFNKRHAFIVINGKFRILREKEDDIEFMTESDFSALHQNMRLPVTEGDKTKMVALTDMWLKSDKHRKFENGIVFNPARMGHYEDRYNLWKGYKILPMAGDVAPFADYMKNVICSGHESNFEYLIQLVSQMFQQPHLKPGVAVVLRGDEGVGKSFFIEKLGALMGEYYFKTSNPSYAFGEHNGQLKNKLLLHLEEAVWAGSKKDESLLKDLITGRTIEINDKFVPVYPVSNHLHLFISGNPDWLVAAGAHARRLFALHVTDARRLDTEHFKQLDEWFWKGGCGALLHKFLNNNITIELRIVPSTNELVEQKKQSLNDVAKWWMSILSTLEMPFGESDTNTQVINGREVTGQVKVIKYLLYHSFITSPMGKNLKMSQDQFGSAWLKLLPRVIDGVVQKASNGKVESIVDGGHKCKGPRGDRENAYSIPNPVECRSAMDYVLSGKTEWNSETEWTILRPNTDEIDGIHAKKRF